MRKLKLFISLLLITHFVSGQMINRDGYSVWTGSMYVGHPRGVSINAPNTSAYLEVGPTSSANKGFLPPRLSTAERDAIASPATGLMIYNKTTNDFQGWNGSAWVNFYIDTAASFISSFYRIGDSVKYVKGGVHTFAFKDSTGVGIPTLQQVLTAGSTLTGNNTIDFNTNTLTFNTNGGYFDIETDDPGNVVQNYKITGEPSNRLQIQGDGLLEWGDGTGADLIALQRWKRNGLGLIDNNVKFYIVDEGATDSSKIIFASGGDTSTFSTKAAIYYNNTNNRFGFITGGNMYIDDINYTLSTTGKKILIRDTATGLVQNIDPSLIGGGTTNTSVGSGYKVAIDGTNNIKSLTAGIGINIDSSTSNQINIKADTAFLVDTSEVIEVDTTGSIDGDEAYLVKATNTVKFRTPTGGGGAIGYLEFTIGDTFSPAVGDSLLIHSYFIGRKTLVWREGEYQMGDSAAVHTDSTILFRPSLQASERIFVEVRDTTGQVNLALEEPPSPVSAWEDITPLAANSGLTETSTNVWEGGSGTWTNIGLSTKSLPSGSDGGLIIQIVNPGGLGDAIIGFNESNSNEAFSAYEAGMYLSWNSGSHPIVYKVTNGTPTSLTSVAYGNYVGVFREGSTWTVRWCATKSTTLSDWTSLGTISYTGTGEMFVNISALNTNSQKMYYPQLLLL